MTKGCFRLKKCTQPLLTERVDAADAPPTPTGDVASRYTPVLRSEPNGPATFMPSTSLAASVRNKGQGGHLCFTVCAVGQHLPVQPTLQHHGWPYAAASRASRPSRGHHSNVQSV